jgi:hypothetical protein
MAMKANPSTYVLRSVFCSACLLTSSLALAAEPETNPPAAPAAASKPAESPSALPPAVLEEAARIYQMGQDAYGKGRYESAFTSFHHAYQMTKAPDLLYNLAKVSVQLGQREVAGIIASTWPDILRMKPRFKKSWTSCFWLRRLGV